MHQQARLAPRLTSPASSPTTNQTQANSQRDAVLGTAQRSASNMTSSPTAEHAAFPGPPAESVKKLDQIVQV